ncbi:protocatechuate 3,4-dioxygenase subunit alpha [Jatrophihabitans sp. YIM 134969]
MSTPTPGQTIGPFFGYALPFAGDAVLVPPGRADAIRLHGRVLDGDGAPVPDALLELWQTDAHGNVPRQPGSLHRDGWTFTGWGRTATDADGHYSFTTVRPGAPFVALTVFARGLLHRLLTRAYLDDVDDALLTSLPPERRATLLATPEPDGYRFDVVLQGADETVFLEYPR